jgi:hypothetical protein
MISTRCHSEKGKKDRRKIGIVKGSWGREEE